MNTISALSYSRIPTTLMGGSQILKERVPFWISVSLDRIVNSRRRRHVCRSPRASNRAAHSNIRTYDCANRHYPSCSSCELLCHFLCARRSLHGCEPPFRRQSFVLKVTRRVAQGGTRSFFSLLFKHRNACVVAVNAYGVAIPVKRQKGLRCHPKTGQDSTTTARRVTLLRRLDMAAATQLPAAAPCSSNICYESFFNRSSALAGTHPFLKDCLLANTSRAFSTFRARGHIAPTRRSSSGRVAP
jgi:hypothetical protein